ncbi:MAG: isochorismatase family protein [Edaphobacter sp.]|uniref:isochorismatase family protein n=1 Tax=Edaphobacter sp. TaxID=1934404 RepID=UPI002399CDCF|nr:isochorismatase family protein [Edaphobacter sp.]MDE1176655.1 isochorismatase family protein [Edaphobacter sp.]
MPITQIDPVAALIVIDLQKGLASIPTNPPLSEVVANSAKLAAAFRSRNLPVVLVNVAGRAPGRTDTPRSTQAFPPDFADLLPELDVQPSDILITKHCPGAFLGTALDEELKKRNVTQVILTGVATGNGVEASARSAHDLGYNLAFIADAMTDPSAEAHAFNIHKVFPRIGEVDTTANTLKLLESERTTKIMHPPS